MTGVTYNLHKTYPATGLFPVALPDGGPCAVFIHKITYLAYIIILLFITSLTTQTTLAQIAPETAQFRMRPKMQSTSPTIPNVQLEYPAIGKIIGRGMMEQIEDGQSQTLYYGSGVYVAEQNDFGIVLTNWHVVSESTESLEVQFPSSSSPGIVILADEVWDLAAVVIHKPSFLPIPISLEVPQIGETLWVAGYGQYPGLNGFQLKKGAVLSYMGLDSNENLPPETIALNVGVRHGDSGGPIFNRYGELAGILWGSEDDLTMGTFCLRLQAFLTQAQYQLMKQTMPANQFFSQKTTGVTLADARKPGDTPGTPSQSNGPLKKIVMPATPAQVALQASGIFPISSKPVYRTEGTAGKNSTATATTITQTSAASETPDRPPYPAISSPTLLAQQRTIGRQHPEVYPTDGASQKIDTTGEQPIVLAANSPQQNSGTATNNPNTTHHSFQSTGYQNDSSVGNFSVPSTSDSQGNGADFSAAPQEEPTKLTMVDPEQSDRKGMLSWFGMNDIQTIIVVLVLLFFFFHAVKLIAIANQ